MSKDADADEMLLLLRLPDHCNSFASPNGVKLQWGRRGRGETVKVAASDGQGGRARRQMGGEFRAEVS